MVGVDGGPGRAARKRSDARRNEAALLDAAAAAFISRGVDAPVRDIASNAGVGVGTIYRHFPTRADLIVAVYRHQLDACAEAGAALLAEGGPAHAALARWIDGVVDFLVTKQGLAEALRSDDTALEALHTQVLARLVAMCARLLDAAVSAGEVTDDIDAYQLMRAVGNLCIGAGGDPRYDAHRMAGLVIAGLRPGPPRSPK